jgi:hypothetical protein
MNSRLPDFLLANVKLIHEISHTSLSLFMEKEETYRSYKRYDLIPFYKDKIREYTKFIEMLEEILQTE